MPTASSRRDFLATTITATGAGVALGAFPASLLSAAEEASMPFKISVAEYSLHRMINEGELDPRDFGPFCKEHFDVDAVEYWMGPFADKAQDLAYMDEMQRKSEDAGVKGLLIMCDIPNGEGNLGHPDASKRQLAVEKHHEWVAAAKRMGCHSIRVNARSEGTPAEQAKLAADGLRKLSEYAAPFGINVIVENHGGLSSDGGWLSGVIQAVEFAELRDLARFGEFPDQPRSLVRQVPRDAGTDAPRQSGQRQVACLRRPGQRDRHRLQADDADHARRRLPRLCRHRMGRGRTGIGGRRGPADQAAPGAGPVGTDLNKRLDKMSNSKRRPPRPPFFMQFLGNPRLYRDSLSMGSRWTSQETGIEGLPNYWAVRRAQPPRRGCPKIGTPNQST